MIEINLLPEERRRKEKPKLPQEFYIIILSALGFLIILHSTTGLMIRWKKQRLVKLTRQWAELAPLKKEVDLIKQETAGLSQRVGGIDRLIMNRFLWSKKLNQLSDSIIPGIWLRELSLSYTPRSLLTLKGSVISRRKDATAVVAKFMANLKNNADFSGDFDDIKLESIESRKIKNTEIMDFALICYFKEGVL